MIIVVVVVVVVVVIVVFLFFEAFLLTRKYRFRICKIYAT